MTALHAVAQRFLDAWTRAEEARGCYSGAFAHDYRCALAPCECGRDELEVAAVQLVDSLRQDTK